MPSTRLIYKENNTEHDSVDELRDKGQNHYNITDFNLIFLELGLVTKVDTLPGGMCYTWFMYYTNKAITAHCVFLIH